MHHKMMAPVVDSIANLVGIQCYAKADTIGECPEPKKSMSAFGIMLKPAGSHWLKSPNNFIFRAGVERVSFAI